MITIYVDPTTFALTPVDTGFFFSAFGPDDDAQTAIVPFEEQNIEVPSEDRGIVVGPRRIGYP